MAEAAVGVRWRGGDGGRIRGRLLRLGRCGVGGAFGRRGREQSGARRGGAGGDVRWICTPLPPPTPNLLYPCDDTDSANQKPFAIYYGLRFVLYELSTPFLNIHWFLDKMGRTGSTLQLVNGIALLASFFAARLVWGSYLSACIYADVWRAWEARGEARGAACAAYQTLERGVAGTGALEELLKAPLRCREMPAGLALFYVGANTALWLLNVYWFGKMVKAVRKRFVSTEQQRGGKRWERPAKVDETADGETNGFNKEHFE